MTTRATSASWDHDEFDEGTALACSGTFTKTELETVAMALVPDEMEDRWFIYMEDLTLFIVSSSNGFSLYRVRFAQSDHDFVISSAEVRRSAGGDLAWHAQFLEYLIRRALLGDESVPLPRLP
jgi:hypothetical protein